MRRTRSPTLTLVYLPHLDYDLQRFGPDDPRVAKSLAEIDAVAGDLIADAERDGARVIVLSEYGISPVSTPIHINRALREAGLLRVRVEDGGELLDVPQSRAFAVADHQIAHIYVAEPDLIGEVKRIVAALPGVEHVLDRERAGARSGSIIRIRANSSRWRGTMPGSPTITGSTTAGAPDFARLVEIHRKPGYDPVELFLDPAIRSPKLAIGWRLARRALGFRTLMDVIPLDASLVKGSHGRVGNDEKAGPLFISSEPRLMPDGPIAATAVKDAILAHVFAA